MVFARVIVVYRKERKERRERETRGNGRRCFRRRASLSLFLSPFPPSFSLSLCLCGIRFPKKERGQHGRTSKECRLLRCRLQIRRDSTLNLRSNNVHLEIFQQRYNKVSCVKLNRVVIVSNFCFFYRELIYVYIYIYIYIYKYTISVKDKCNIFLEKDAAYHLRPFTRFFFPYRFSWLYLLSVSRVEPPFKHNLWTRE